MTLEHQVTGYYSTSKHVSVFEEKSYEFLKQLGHFGIDLEYVKKKNSSKVGQIERDLYQDPQVKTILSLHEAFFLAYGLGCLTIKSQETDRTLDIGEIWSTFRQSDNTRVKKLDFAIEYAVFHYFRSHDWIVKSGDNYGTHFLLYHEGPSIDHAQYAVVIVYDEEYTWKSLLTFHRVTQSVSKDLLIAHISPCTETTIDLSVPSCIKNLKVRLEIFKNAVNHLPK